MGGCFLVKLLYSLPLRLFAGCFSDRVVAVYKSQGTCVHACRVWEDDGRLLPVHAALQPPAQVLCQLRSHQPLP